MGALLLSAVTSWCAPQIAHADYPVQEGRGIADNSGYSYTGLGYDDATACTNRGPAYSWGHTGDNECGSQQVHILDYPIHRGWCYAPSIPYDGCHVSAPITWCPFGGSNWGTTCVNPPACADGGPRDPDTGACGASPKNLGGCGASGSDCPECCAGNPINAGIGSKVQVETVYRGASPEQLLERLTYNSRALVDEFPLTIGGYGKGWRGNYERQINGDTVVQAVRSSARVLIFRAPASGSVYVAEADVADQLERLTDGSGTLTGWKYVVAADDSTELYGPTGQLLSITSRSGLTTTLTYSTGATPVQIAPTTGMLITVTDPFGRAINYVYDSQRRIVSMTDPAGGGYSFAYDSDNNLASITFPDTKVRAFSYNEAAFTQNTSLPNSLTGITDENGNRFATFGYDTSGRAISSEHAGAVERVTVDYTLPSTRTLTDTFGVARTYDLATLIGVVKNTGITGAPCPGCGPAARTFDANGNVSSKTDWNGNRTNYTYDLATNLETQRVEGLASDGSPTAQTRTISTEWDANFRLPTRIAEPLRITTNVYDADGTACGARGVLCSKTIQATTDANGSLGFGATTTGTPRTWTYTYNANGLVLTANGPRTDVADTTTYTYYVDNDADPGKRGNVATITNALNQVTQVTAYNGNGQPITIVDPNGLTTTLAYDSRMRLTSRTMGSEITGYENDGVGQLTKVTLPDGSYLSYTYDAAHRLTGMQDNLGNRIAYTLDAMGNRTQEQVFDPSSNLAQTRSRVYSNLNRLFQEIGAASQTTQYSYDDQGNVTGVTDPLNHPTANAYDALNRLIQVTDPNTGVTHYAYNGLDALTSVTDPRNLVTGYTVNGLGDLTQQSSPDTGATGNTYDAAGNLLTQTDAKSQTTTYAYDALNRVTSITFQDGSKQTYAYDQGANGVGRLTSITETDPASQVTDQIAYAYDQHGRVTSETRAINGVPYVTAYSYDSAGRMNGMTYPSGRTVTYTFDALGRVSEIDTTKDTQNQVVVQAVTYQPFGGVKGYTLGNGQVYSRTIDQDGRIASYTLGNSTYGITFDAASRITGIAETGNPANANTYGYDVLDRLTSAVLPASSYGYSYDAVGNRLTKTVGANSDTYTYSPTSNQIASITPASGPVRNFSFDANGSTTDDAVNQYAYDARGRLVQATTAQGTTAYQVNALGQRFRKTSATKDTAFLYDIRGHLIAEMYPGGGGVKREILYLGDIPVGVVQ